jgi:type I restriction enzyme M protein
MAEAKWCGHDSRGRPIPKDDLPQIADDFEAFRSSKSKLALGYHVTAHAICSGVLSPRYHEPTAAHVINHLASTHKLVSIQDLIDTGLVEIRTGDEVGKLNYGTGPVPFVRTSDISGWEIKIDPKHCVSEDLYSDLKMSQDVRRNDILMVRDGTYLIGSCAIVTEYDERIVYQSHIYKIRCLNQKRLSPYLLLAILSSKPVQRQIKAKTFTQDIIDSLGARITEIVLPIPKSSAAREQIESLVRKVIADRVEARELARKAKLLVVDPNFGAYSDSTSACESTSGSAFNRVVFATASDASPSM